MFRIDLYISIIALLISIASFCISIYFWKRSFRPIVSAMVKTHLAKNQSITYNLVLLNSGSIPAKNITVSANIKTLDNSFGSDATVENKSRWLACFDENTKIETLHNNAHVSCSFGTTAIKDTGFWKYGCLIDVEITYFGWFGTKYKDHQKIKIIDSDSFTGKMWGI